MVTIDGKKIIFSTSFMVKNDQEALVDVPIAHDILKLSFTFRLGISSDQMQAEWKKENGILRFNFTGWNNPLGTCVPEPTKFGNLADKLVYFQLAHQYFAEQNLAHLFIFVGE